jgi:hypothetical protein
LQAATIAAKISGESIVSRLSLVALLFGKRVGGPLRRDSTNEWLTALAKERGRLAKEHAVDDVRAKNMTQMSGPWRPNEAWKSNVINDSLLNDVKPPCSRNYFSAPVQEKDLHNTEGLSVTGKSSTSRGSPNSSAITLSPKVDTNRGNASARAASSSPPRRLDFKVFKATKAWDNTLDLSSEANGKKPAATRSYFSGFGKPTKQELDRKRGMQKSKSIPPRIGSPMDSEVGPGRSAKGHR